MNAENSICWNCKFGICIKETEQERIFHTGDEETLEDPYDIFNEQQKSPEVLETTIEHERTKTICFWKPEGVEDSPPILVAKVEQCNRFKKE